jgi:hypothetical protein
MPTKTERKVMNDKSDELAKNMAQSLRLMFLCLTAAALSAVSARANDSLGGAYFIGDYEGLTTVGNDFLATWSQPHDTDPDSIFFRRTGP